MNKIIKITDKQMRSKYGFDRSLLFPLARGDGFVIKVECKKKTRFWINSYNVISEMLKEIKVRFGYSHIIEIEGDDENVIR